MEIEKIIRKLVLSGNADDIRALLLNKHQRELYDLVQRAGTFRASLLASTEGISIQNASSQLNTLYRRGYLKRTCISSDTGGNEYFYETDEDC